MIENPTIPIEQLATLERNVALLYDRFAERYPEDRDFWLKLRNEEYEHERILNNAQALRLEVQAKTDTPLEFSEEVASMMIAKIQSLLHETQLPNLSRKEALCVALQLEQSAGEFHLQCITHSLTDQNLFPQLWKNDFEHSVRIRAYLERMLQS